MKLLSRQELKDRASKTFDAHVEKTVAVMNAAAKANRELNSITDRLLKAEAEEKARIQASLRALEDERTGLAHEVRALEERKREALKPLSERLQAVAVKEREIAEREERSSVYAVKLAKDNQDVLDQLELLTLRMDEVEIREEKAKKHEATALQFLQSSKETYAVTQKRAKEWEKEAMLARSALEKREEEATRERAVIRAERGQIELLRKTLEEEKSRISSERAKLANAFKEAKQRGITT